MTFASPSDVPVATTVHNSEFESEDVVDPNVPDENALAVISDESMLGGDQAVIHLQIQQQEEVEDRGNGDGDVSGQVFLIYQDIHTCGTCSKHFLDIVDFIIHKSLHMIGEQGYKCELCKMLFMEQTLLGLHYQRIHHIRLVNSAEVCAGIKDGSGSGSDHGNNDEHTAELGDDGDACSNGPPDGDMEDMCADAKPTDVAAKTCDDEDMVDSHDFGDTINMDIVKDHGGVNAPGLMIREIPTCDAKLMLPISVKADTRLMCENQVGYSDEERKMVDDDVVEDRLCNNKIATPAAESDKRKTHVKAEVGMTCIRRGRRRNNVRDDASARSNVDFNFVLCTESIKGNAFSYGRTWCKCLHCDYKTRSKNLLINHMTNKHRDLLELHASLTVDDSSWSSETPQTSRKRVMRMSAYDALCSNNYHSKHLRRPRKLEKQDVPGVYPCHVCGKMFSRLRYLRKHTETHRTERHFVCDVCGKSFKSRTYLTVHKRVHREKLFHCNQCEFTSCINAAIHAHRQVHSQGSVLCDTCGYAYTDKATLNKHKRVHDLTRPYACNFPGCTWRFKTETMCRAHIRAHTTEGKFKCSFCGYVFRHKHHLQRHESNMHGIKHTKSRSHNTHKPPGGDLENNSERDDDINLVISANMQAAGIELSIDQAATSLSLNQQHLVVTTDTNGTPITYEANDIAALIHLMPPHYGSSGVDTDECRAILMPHSSEVTSSVFPQD